MALEDRPRRQLDRVAVGDRRPPRRRPAAKRPIRSWVSASCGRAPPGDHDLRAGRAISTAAAWPMPLPPPVTHAILPARLMRGLVGRTYHDGPGELVVPPLLAACRRRSTGIRGTPERLRTKYVEEASMSLRWTAVLSLRRLTIFALISIFPGVAPRKRQKSMIAIARPMHPDVLPPP